MIIAHHLVWTAYGWWLPNDPRGSWSDEIRIERIADLGDAHLGRKPVQPPSRELRAFYDAAEQTLAHDLLRFDANDQIELAAGLAEVIRTRRYTCYAAALMPDHVHLAIRLHRDRADQMLTHFQSATRARLRLRSLRPATHPVWGGPGWKVFITTERHLRTTICYIEQNPLKARLPAQTWDFVTPYDGWLPGLHPDRKRPPRP